MPVCLLVSILQPCPLRHFCLCLRAITSTAFWQTCPGFVSKLFQQTQPGRSQVCWNTAWVCNHGQGCRKMFPAVLLNVEDHHHGSHSVLRKLNSSLWHAAVTYPPCQSVQRLLVEFHFFLSLAVSPSAWPSVCLPACSSAGLCAGIPISLSPLSVSVIDCEVCCVHPSPLGVIHFLRKH